VANQLEEELAKEEYSPPVAAHIKTTISWKKKLNPGEEVSFDRNPPYLWSTPEAAEVLTEKQIQELDSQISLIKYSIRVEQEFKYLQANLLHDLLDKLIATGKKEFLDPARSSNNLEAIK